MTLVGSGWPTSDSTWQRRAVIRAGVSGENASIMNAGASAVRETQRRYWHHAVTGQYRDPVKGTGVATR